MPMNALHQEEEGPRVREEAPREDGMVKGDGTQEGERPKGKAKVKLKDLARDTEGKARARGCMDPRVHGEGLTEATADWKGHRRGSHLFKILTMSGRRQVWIIGEVIGVVMKDTTADARTS